MDTSNGNIYQMLKGESLRDLAVRTGALEKNLVELQRMPSGVCQKCKGTGVLKRGLFSRRFKPCSCTQ